MEYSEMYPIAKKKMSDTQVFNEIVLKKLPDGWFYNEGVKVLLEDFMGFSKMVIMNNKGEVLILKEDKGNWIDGVWFSNDLWDRSYIVGSKTSYASLGCGTYYQSAKSCWLNSWNCGKDMVAGAYKKGSHYCSEKCEKEDRAENSCDNCGCSYAYMSAQVGGKGTYYSYCSWKCRDEHATQRH